MYCSNCGKEIKEENKFCSKCEASISEETPQKPSITIPLSSGRISTSFGAMLVIICFLLPWSGGCSGYDYARIGLESGGSDPSIELLLLLAIPILGLISLVFIWSSKQGWLPSLLSAIGGIISLSVLHSKSDVSIANYQEGVWGTVVGFALIVIGSIVESVSFYAKEG